MQRDSQERRTVVGGKREEIYNGQMRIKSLELRVGRECSISRGGPDSTVEVYMSEESEEVGVTVLWQGRQLQE